MNRLAVPCLVAHTVMLLGVWSDLFQERNVGVRQLRCTVLLRNSQEGVRNWGFHLESKIPARRTCPAPSSS